MRLTWDKYQILASYIPIILSAQIGWVEVVLACSVGVGFLCQPGIFIFIIIIIPSVIRVQNILETTETVNNYLLAHEGENIFLCCGNLCVEMQHRARIMFNPHTLRLILKLHYSVMNCKVYTFQILKWNQHYMLL